MHYLNDAVWVIGKSVKVDLRSGPADVGVSLKIPDGHKPDMRYVFEINFSPSHFTTHFICGVRILQYYVVACVKCASSLTVLNTVNFPRLCSSIPPAITLAQ